MTQTMMSSPTDTPTEFMRNWPFFWISQINAAYTDALERRIRPHGIDVPRWRAMMSLYQSEYLSVSQIATYSAQKLNTTTKVVQRMISDGLVATRVSPTDGRVTEVCLTEKGGDLCRKAVIEAQAVFQMTFADMSPSEVEKLNATLASIAAQVRKL